MLMYTLRIKSEVKFKIMCILAFFKKFIDIIFLHHSFSLMFISSLNFVGYKKEYNVCIISFLVLQTINFMSLDAKEMIDKLEVVQVKKLFHSDFLKC